MTFFFFLLSVLPEYLVLFLGQQRKKKICLCVIFADLRDLSLLYATEADQKSFQISVIYDNKGFKKKFLSAKYLWNASGQKNPKDLWHTTPSVAAGREVKAVAASVPQNSFR